MRIDTAGALAEAAARYRSERPALHAVAGLFFFLPALAMFAFVEPAAADPADQQAAIAAFQQTLIDNWHWLAATQLFQLAGSAWLMVWLVDPQRRPLGEAFAPAMRLLPFYAIAAVVVGFATFGGFLLFLAPGFYVIGRTFLLTPAFFGEARGAPLKAIERSVALTTGNGWRLFMLSAAIWLAGQLPHLLLSPIGATLGTAGAVLVNVVGALAVAAVTLALLLVRIAVYRRVAGSISGI